MSLEETYVLSESATLTPVRELPEVLRRDIGVHDADDVVLSRVNSRTSSKLLCAQAARLTAQFCTPRTIAQAVKQFSRDAGFNFGAVVVDALPMLQSLIESGFLVSPNAENISAMTPSLPPAAEVDRWTILHSIQTMEDTEVYQVRSNSQEIAALKIGRAGRAAATCRLKREARVLSYLHPAVTPRLLSFGFWDSRPYLVTEWLAGTDADKAFAEFRTRGNAGSKSALWFATSATLRAYATLHKQGVIHGDIHPRNVLIGHQYSVKILDFGAARILGSAQVEDAARVGVSFFLEPEVAQAIRRAACTPRASEKGEQYALAAMLYYLLTGQHYLDFTVEKAEMLRQIAEGQMVSFRRRGFESLPAAELVLRKALSKKPEDRFSAVKDFAGAWALAGAASREI